MLSRFHWVVAPMVFILVACGAPSRSSQSPSAFSNVITRSELLEADVRNVYEAIERLRPRWLIVRSGMRSFNVETEVVVFEDQMFLGNQGQLRGIGTEGIFEIRYLDGATAQATLPGIADRHVQGAIVIYRSPPPD